MAKTQSSLTDAQHDLLGAIDDVVEHVHAEVDRSDYSGPSTCGFAHIANIDGRSKFVQRFKSLSESDATRQFRTKKVNPRRESWYAEVGGLTFSLTENHDSGYRLSVSGYMSGPEVQRLDYKEALHRAVLNRLQYNGYCDDCRVSSRMD